MSVGVCCSPSGRLTEWFWQADGRTPGATCPPQARMAYSCARAARFASHLSPVAATTVV